MDFAAELNDLSKAVLHDLTRIMPRMVCMVHGVNCTDSNHAPYGLHGLHGLHGVNCTDSNHAPYGLHGLHGVNSTGLVRFVWCMVLNI